MRGLFARYRVTGEKTELLTGFLHAAKIGVYDLKIINKGIILTIEYKHHKKLFAICLNMCYNIKREGYRGTLAPFKYAAEKAGLILGALAFTLAAFLSDGIITEVVYAGDAAYIGNEISAALKDLKSVGQEDLAALEEQLTLSKEEISFVSIVKRGHKLCFEVYLAKGESKPSALRNKSVLSPATGKVRRLVCISGTPLVKAGDEVKAGDVIIDATYSHGEKTGETYALGEAEIECEEIFVYEGEGDDENLIRRAKAIAAANLGEREIISSDAVITKDGTKKICTVRTVYLVLTE